MHHRNPLLSPRVQRSMWPTRVWPLHNVAPVGLTNAVWLITWPAST